MQTVDLGRFNATPTSNGPVREALGRATTSASKTWVETHAAWLFWIGAGGVFVLMAFNALWGLSNTFVRDLDEARYGVAASEMLHSHSLLITTYAGATEFWNLKPPLGYWLLEVSYLAVGETPLGLRLPAALCGLLTVVLTLLVGRRLGGWRVGLLAGLMLATSTGVLAHHGARSGELDSQLTFLLLLWLMLALRLPESRAARLAAGLVLALAFLLKSFAILPFVGAVGLYYLWVDGARSWRLWVLPTSIVLLVTVVWAAARTGSEGSDLFVQRMFLEDLLLRSSTVIDTGAEGHVWDYPGALIDRLAPWPLLAIGGWALRRWVPAPTLPDREHALLWTYALVPLVLFSLARTHHGHYILPTYPAWAILAAASVYDLTQRWHRTWPRAAMLAFVTLGLGVGEERLVSHMIQSEQLSSAQKYLSSLRAQLAESTAALHLDFTPSYSERFFLQVVDGFTLDNELKANVASDSACNAILSKTEANTGSEYALAQTGNCGPQKSILTLASTRRGHPGMTVWLSLTDSK